MGLESLPTAPLQVKKSILNLHHCLPFVTWVRSVTFPEGSMNEYVDSLKKLANDHGMPSDVFDNSVAFSDTVSQCNFKLE